MATSGKGRADHLVLGDWNVMCFQCGRKRKASYMKKHWQGYWVCPEHWEARHPQDFVRGAQDIQTPPWVQPMGTDMVLNQCGWCDQSSIAGVGVAGCMVPGFVPAGC